MLLRRPVIDVYAHRGTPVKAPLDQHRRDLPFGLHLVQTGEMDRADFGQAGDPVLRHADVKRRTAVLVESRGQRHLQDIARPNQVALVLRGRQGAKVDRGRIMESRGLKRRRQFRWLVDLDSRAAACRKQQGQKRTQTER